MRVETTEVTLLHTILHQGVLEVCLSSHMYSLELMIFPVTPKLITLLQTPYLLNSPIHSLTVHSEWYHYYSKVLLMLLKFVHQFNHKRILSN